MEDYLNDLNIKIKYTEDMFLRAVKLISEDILNKYKNKN